MCQGSSVAEVHSEVQHSVVCGGGGAHRLQELKYKCTRPVKRAKEEDGNLLVSTFTKMPENESNKNICCEKATCHEVLITQD